MNPFGTFWSLLKMDLDFYKVSNLGNVKDLPILLIRPKTMNSEKKNILITAGFHGNEIAGPQCLNKLLTEDKFKLYDANISIIPIVSPDGFSNGTRYNQWGEISNQGFMGGDTTPSREGAILLNNSEELKELGADGFLSLHENDRSHHFYFYVLAGEKPHSLMKKLHDIGKNTFGLQPDGIYNDEREGKYTIENGCVYNHFDDTFEDYMFSKGTPVCVVPETPSLHAPIDKRVEVTCDVVNLFLKEIQ